MSTAPIVVIFLTTMAGAGAAFGLANFLIFWQQIPDREGASGYFALYLTVFGLIGGFIVGLITALAVRSGFWRAQAFAVGAVVVLTVTAGVLAIVLDDEGPTLDGRKLEVEVELQCPRGLDPAETAKSESGNFCWIQQQPADAALEVNPIVSGEFTIAPPVADQPPVVRCVVPLTKSSKNRYLRVFFGHADNVTLRIPLAGKPSRRDMNWSGWNEQGFLPQSGKAAATGYSFRLRVQTENPPAPNP